jgi:hypothetical protein
MPKAATPMNSTVAAKKKTAKPVLFFFPGTADLRSAGLAGVTGV